MFICALFSLLCVNLSITDDRYFILLLTKCEVLLIGKVAFKSSIK